MSKKRPSPQYVAELRRLLCAQSTSAAWPEDLTWAYAFLNGQDPAPPSTMDGEVLSALIEELLERQQTDRLATLARSSAKEVSKAARTAMHRLRSHHVKVEVPTAKDGEWVSGTGLIESGPPSSLASVIQPNWERYILLVDRDMTRGVMGVWARLSARMGLLDLDLFQGISRKELRAIVQRVEKRVVSMPVSLDDARFFIEDAVRLCRKRGRALPTGYAQATTMLGPAATKRHPALDIPAADASPEDLLDLYDLPLLKLWVPDSLILRRLSMKLQNLLESPIVISPDQKRERFIQVLDEEAVQLFDAAGRHAARQVLLDAAHLADLSGDVLNATRLRRASEIAAAEIRGAGTANAFQRRFLERLVRMPGSEPDDPEHEAEPEELRSRGGLILPPGLGSTDEE